MEFFNNIIKKYQDTVQRIQGNQLTVSPISPVADKENVRQLKRQDYIKEGATFSNMNPYEKQIKKEYITPTPTPTVTPIPGMGSNARNQDTDRFILETILPITRQYGIPDAVAAGMFAGEGRLGGLGAARNNFYNINAIDSDPNQAFDYETPGEGIEAYAKLLSGKYELGQKGSGRFDTTYLPAYTLRNDPMAMLKMIQELGYASRPDYSDFIMSTPEYNYYNQL